MNNGIYGGRLTDSAKSAYQSERTTGVGRGEPLGPQYVEEPTSNAYRAALGHALRGDGPRGSTTNMPALIEYSALNATDMIGIQSRLARIAGALGKHLPLKNDQSGPSSPPESMLQQLEVVNNTQRNAIDASNSLLAEIEQALGI